MANFVYFAKRSIKAGHVLEDSYNIEIPLAQFNITQKVNRSSKTALDGVTMQNTFNSVSRDYQLTTGFVDIDPATEENLDWVEFLDSVAGGEEFTFDAYGTDLVPVNQQLVKMISPVSMQRVGTEQIMQFSFSVRVVG